MDKYYNKGQVDHYKSAKLAHDQLKEHHEGHVASLKDDHSFQTELWEQSVADEGLRQAERELMHQEAHDRWEEVSHLFEDFPSTLRDGEVELPPPEEPQIIGVSDFELKKPDAPVLPNEPLPPDPPQPYAVREITAPEEVTTQWGPTIAMPPAYVLTGPDGSVHIVTPQQLAMEYTTEEP